MLTTENTLTLAIDFQAKMVPPINKGEEMTRKSVIFLEGCRILGVPILVTQQYTRGLGETIPEIKKAVGEHTPIEKITFSCFGCDEYEEKLKKSGKKKILVTGIEAHICVQQTVLGLLDRDYEVYILADCVGARSKVDYKYAIRRMEKAGAIITTTESALFEMMVSADHPHRKAITALVT